MFRRKGWTHEYDRMTAEEVRAERKRLMISRGFIYEKEAKLSYLSKLPRAEYCAASGEPGSIIWVKNGRADGLNPISTPFIEMMANPPS